MLLVLHGLLPVLESSALEICKVSLDHPCLLGLAKVKEGLDGAEAAILGQAQIKRALSELSKPLGEHRLHHRPLVVLADSVCPLSQPCLIAHSLTHSEQVTLQSAHLPDLLSLVRQRQSAALPPRRGEPFVEVAALDEARRQRVQLSILRAGMIVE